MPLLLAGAGGRGINFMLSGEEDTSSGKAFPGSSFSGAVSPTFNFPCIPARFATQFYDNHGFDHCCIVVDCSSSESLAGEKTRNMKLPPVPVRF